MSGRLIDAERLKALLKALNHLSGRDVLRQAIYDEIHSGRLDAQSPTPGQDGLPDCVSSVTNCPVYGSRVGVSSSAEGTHHYVPLNTRPTSQWIPVSERLPERGQNVFYWHKPPVGYGPHGYPAIADEWHDEHHLKHASHWMPINAPLPPSPTSTGERE